MCTVDIDFSEGLFSIYFYVVFLIIEYFLLILNFINQLLMSSFFKEETKPS
jgi:hypothetical protein